MFRWCCCFFVFFFCFFFFFKQKTAYEMRISDWSSDVCSSDLAPTLALLSPIDLQCVKAAGVTFALSAVERVIEERARGDASAAGAIRAALEARVGDRKSVV